MTPSNGTKVAVAPMTLLIDPAAYATPHTITVTSREDDDVADEQLSLELQAAGAVTTTVRISIADNDGLGLLASPGSALEITEGTSETLGLRLSTRPDAPVTATLVSNNTLAATFTPASLTFTPENWQTTQQVTISAPEDADTTNEQGGIEIAGHGIADIAVTVTAFDDDLLGIAPTSTNLGTMTEGANRPVSIRLMQAPSATIQVGVTPSDTAVLAVDRSNLTFTPGNWSTPQTVEVTSLQDVDTVGRNTSLTLTSSGLGTRTVVAAIADDDVQAIVAANQLAVPEELTAVLDVKLAFQPEGDVIIDATSMAPATASVTPPRITFTRDNYNILQHFTVTATDDLDAVPGSAMLHLEEGMTGMTKDIELQIIEDDVMAIEASVPSLSMTEGSQATIGVRLTALPLSPLVVTPGTSDSSAAMVPTSPVTFDSSNWNSFQPFLVQAVDDLDLAAENVAISLTAEPTLSTSIVAMISDNDTQQIELLASSVSLSEGASANVGVRLRFQPLGTVTFGVSSSHPTSASVPATMTFTPSNYSTSQNLRVTGLQDDNVIGENATITILGGGAASNVSFAANVTDNDTLSIVVGTGSLTVGEAGTATFSVHLGAQPSSALNVTIESSDNSALSIDNPTLTFDSANWNTQQTVTVRGVQDGDLANETATITCRSNGIPTQQLSASVIDEDQQAVIVTPSMLTVPEGGFGTFTVRLQFQPSGDVTVNLSSSNTNVASVSPSSMLFGPGNFSTPRAVNVFGQQDSNSSDNGATISVSANNSIGAQVNITVDDDGMSCGDGVCRPPETPTSCREDCCGGPIACFQ